MRLSISVKATTEGFVPRLVLEVPSGFTVIPAGDTCSSFNEAWMMAKLKRKTIRSRK